jgi:hypothetical protein
MHSHQHKLRRALHHLKDLNREIRSWENGSHYTGRCEYDPSALWTGPIPPQATSSLEPVWHLEGSVFPKGVKKVPLPGAVYGKGCVRVFAAPTRQPPPYPISVLIGDVLHNLRSALDHLAYALACAYTKPLPQEMANSSEFPIFRDEAVFRERSRSGAPTKRSGLHKIRAWHPEAQALVERHQPYHAEQGGALHPLLLVHDLDRISKHRLIHTALAFGSGTTWDPGANQNLLAIGPGLIRVFHQPLQGDTPVAEFWGIHPIIASEEVEMDLHPAVDVALDTGGGTGDHAPVARMLNQVYKAIRDDIVPRYERFL